MDKKITDRLVYISVIAATISVYGCKLDPPIYPNKPFNPVQTEPAESRNLYVKTLVSGSNNLIKPSRVCTTKDGDIFITSYTGGKVYKVTPKGVVSTVLDDLNKPLGIKADELGNIYVILVGDNKLLKLKTNGQTSMVKLNTTLKAAQDFAIGPDGTIYIADTGNNRIVKVDAQGNSTTLAGKIGVTGTRDGSGAGAYFTFPTNIRFASDGFLWVIDGDISKKTGQSVRRITTKGQVNTYFVQKDKSVGILDIAPAKRDKDFSPAQTIGLFLIYDNNTISHLGTNGVKTDLVTPLTSGFQDGDLEFAQFSKITGISINSNTMYIVDQGNAALRFINTTKPSQ